MAVVNHDIVDFYNLVDGLNTVSSAIRLKLSEARDIQNMDLFPIGGVSKRSGFTDIAEAGAAVEGPAVTGLYQGRYSLAGGTNILYRVTGAALYKSTNLTSWTDITGSLVITAGDNNIWNFSMLNDYVVMGNGDTDAAIKIDSSGAATALTPGPFTKYTFGVESRGYMFYFVPTVSGTVQYDRAYFSNINDPGTVGTNNYIDVAKGQGGSIGGAVDYKTYVYIFKTHGIYQINYQPSRVNSSGTLFPWNEFPNPVVPGVGTKSPRSVVKFTTPSTHATPGQELVFFVDQFGVPRIFDGTTTISFSSKIGASRDTTIISLASMDSSRTKYAFSINYPSKNRILCFMSQDNSQQDTCWVLDYNVGFAWTRYAYADAFNCGTLVEKSDGTFKPYAGNYDSHTFQLDSGSTDNGQPIDDYYVTGDTFLKSPVIRNKWHFLEVRGTNGGDSQSTTINYYEDGGDTPVSSSEIVLSDAQTEWSTAGDPTPSMIWGESDWAKQGLITRSSEPMSVAKTLRVKIGSTDKLNDSLTLEGWSLAGQPLGTAHN